MITPARRKSQLWLSRTISESTDVDSVNDDEAEKRSRRQEKVLELARNSPKRRSHMDSRTNLHGMTNSMLVEHYTNCIKLSTENKITVKNAFALHLIDYMAEMIKKDSQLDNFQVAGCTLDASAKIYSFRVDCVHADTIKIASGLSCTSDGNKAKKRNQDMEDGEEVNDDDQPTKKKKVRRGRTIEENLKAITSTKLEVQNEVDPVLRSISQRFLQDGSSSGVFLTSLYNYSEVCGLLLDSSTPFNAKPRTVNPKVIEIDATDLHPLFKTIVKPESRICTAFDGFKYGNWKIGDNIQYEEKRPMKDDNLDSVDDQGAGDCFDNDVNYDSPTDAIQNEDEKANMLSDAKSDAASLFDKINSEGMIMDALSTQPSEYSYFKPQFLLGWAGPNHWRVNPRSKENNVTGVTKTKIARTKKPPIEMDFLAEINFDPHFKKSRLSQRLANSTLQSWSDMKTTLPEDSHYEEKLLFQLFLNQSLTVCLRDGGLTIKDDSGLGGYNYENTNDVDNFCPQNEDSQHSMYSQNNNFDDMDTESQFPNTQPEKLENGYHLTGENLIEKPFQVPTFEIPYPRTAKRVNVKHVKECIWDWLSEGTPKTTVETRKTDTKRFRKLYEDLPEKVTTQTAKNLSVPIALNCLLHLANEKILKIQSIENLEDLTIEIDD